MCLMVWVREGEFSGLVCFGVFWGVVLLCFCSVVFVVLAFWSCSCPSVVFVVLAFWICSCPSFRPYCYDRTVFFGGSILSIFGVFFFCQFLVILLISLSRLPGLLVLSVLSVLIYHQTVPFF